MSHHLTAVPTSERHGWAVVHDLALPQSQANIDHLLIGPGGVFVIDSKQYRGRLQLDPSGRLLHGRHPLAPRYGRRTSKPTRPQESCPTRAWPWCRSWLCTAPRSPGARWSPTGCRWWRPGACQACFASPRQCWGPSGSPGWPTRPGSSSTPPPNLHAPSPARVQPAGPMRCPVGGRSAGPRRRPRPASQRCGDQGCRPPPDPCRRSPNSPGHGAWPRSAHAFCRCS